MSAIKIAAFIAAAILIFFGVLFIWGAFSPEGSPLWIIIGLISVAIGFGLIWFGSRQKAAGQASGQDMSVKLDLPGEVKLESMKCQSCGGVLSAKNITMVAGAPMVHCPYCGTSYQLTEEPKW